jgi:Family of unknown function (DUF6134)
MFPSSLIAACLLLVDSNSLVQDTPPPRQGTQVYAIKVDGKVSGSCQMNVADHADGTRCLAINADVRVKQYLFTYKYSFSGTEIWKDGVLVRLDCVANDNGKKTNLTGVLEGSLFSMSVNGVPKTVAPIKATTIYSMLPPASHDKSLVDLLDVDTGEIVRQRLEKLEATKGAPLGNEGTTEHFQWSGKEKVDVWFDADGTLQRLTTIDDGHPTEWIRKSNP